MDWGKSSNPFSCSIVLELIIPSPSASNPISQPQKHPNPSPILPLQNPQSNKEEGWYQIDSSCTSCCQKEIPKIIVQSPDTDVLVLLISCSTSFQTNQLLLDTVFGDMRHNIDVNASALDLEEDPCLVFFGFHSFTGCDTTSAFVRKGKLRPIKLLQRLNRDYISPPSKI